MILTWLNNSNGKIYTRFYNSYIFTDFYVGFKNSYQHEVIQILILCDNKLYNVSNYTDFVSKKTSCSNRQNKVLTFIKKLI